MFFHIPIKNALRRNSREFDYPHTGVIAKWIELSRWFRVKGKTVEFLGEKRELTDIEKSVVDYLSAVDHSLYPPLKDYLLAKGYIKATIDKAVTASPLVTVDKSGQRKTYKYTLVSRAGAIDENLFQEPNKYQGFRNRLKSLLTTGTDMLGESLSRREQAILREWLFGNN